MQNTSLRTFHLAPHLLRFHVQGFGGLAIISRVCEQAKRFRDFVLWFWVCGHAHIFRDLVFRFRICGHAQRLRGLVFRFRSCGHVQSFRDLVLRFRVYEHVQTFRDLVFRFRVCGHAQIWRARRGGELTASSARSSASASFFVDSDSLIGVWSLRLRGGGCSHLPRNRTLRPPRCLHRFLL